MEQDLTIRWRTLEKWLEERFSKKMTLESIIFLVGMRELGEIRKTFTKEEKVDLMHIAICRLFSQSGYYQLSHVDQDGWPHWDLVKPLPNRDIFSQEYLLKEHILAYFEAEEIFE
ncbi:MAG: hypothetical protein AAF694_29425 [Bacteroidota bacterium]